jgi:gamma-glutamyl-gamma-aminobutyrate hydrolase PuuD
MKIVAVSQRVDPFPEREETRDAMDQRLSAFIVNSGYMPVAVPNALGGAIRDWLTVVHPAAVVLSGGNDILQFIDRDDTELALLAHAQERQLPVLGICRGMQMMAHWAGTGLHPVQGHVRTRHLLSGEITGDVNSYHGFALAACPTGFEVLAFSEDDEIEAIRHQSLPWEGWMWHPEREATFAERDIQRLKALFL